MDAFDNSHLERDDSCQLSLIGGLQSTSVHYLPPNRHCDSVHWLSSIPFFADVGVSLDFLNVLAVCVYVCVCVCVGMCKSVGKLNVCGQSSG